MLQQNYFFESSGLTFESDIIEAIETVCVKAWGREAIIHSTTKQDQQDGTDLFILKVPVDVTLNLSTKSHTRKLGNEIDFGFGKIVFGIRYGNRHRKFSSPVLIIGVETNIHINQDSCKLLINNIKEYLFSAIEIGMDRYLEYEC